MANQATPVKIRTENCVDETIVSTPLPAATSTVNKNLSPCLVAPKPVQTSGTASRLTNTIKELESFTKALGNVGNIPTGKRRSVLAVNETDRSFDSNSSLGLLDIDKLLENETMDDSQVIIKTLYQIRDRMVNKSSKELGKSVVIPERDPLQQSDHQNSSSKVYQNQTSNTEEKTMASQENSHGVPYCFLASESYISEGPSIDCQSSTARNDMSMSETSAEVAAITQKDSFASGRLTFEPTEFSSRSTSTGGSSEISSRKSDFSGVVGDGQIVVRPSWIGLEGCNDEPINISVGEYFRLKSNVLSDTIDGKKNGGERPNFGMEIRSPEKREQSRGLVSDSIEDSLKVPKRTADSKVNETLVLSTPSLSQQIGIADVSEYTTSNVNSSHISSVPSVIATPSITCIDKILNEIDLNDSPDTMARKFLEYTTISEENKASYDKNVIVPTPSNEYDNGQPWVKIPEKILLPEDEGKLPKKQPCVGIGSTFHVPITNVTNSWLKYEVNFLKSKSTSNVVLQKLPVSSLISPESCVEFEVMFAPMSTGRHFIVLEVNVTNLMMPVKSAQVYQCQLILEANIPKVVVMNENMKEINADYEIDFGLLPENCTKNIQLLILNVGQSDIPIRVGIQEMPSHLHTFEISSATRSPSVDLRKHYEGYSSTEGFSLERKDLLICNLLGSGPNSILAVSLAFNSPNINKIPPAFAHSMDSSKIIKLSAKLTVELDVPSYLSTDLTTLKEIQLCGSVGETNLIIGVSSEPVTLNSEEMILPTAVHNQKIFKKVSEYIPICNSSIIPLQLKNVIHSVDGDSLLERDVMVVDPDNLTIQPGEKIDIKVTYHPNKKKAEKCDRVLIIQVNPNGPSYKVQLRGVPLALEGRRSTDRKKNRPKLPATKTSLPGAGTNIIQASQTALVWSSVAVGSGGVERSIALKNVSDTVVRLTLTVNGTDDFKFLNHNSDSVGQASFDLLPNKAEKLKFFFRPKVLGPIRGKLIISICSMKYPERSIPNKMIILLGYGGHSEIEAVSLPKDLAGRLWLNLGIISLSSSANPPGARSSRPSTPTLSSVKNRIQILNTGTLPSLVKITPLKLGVDSKLLSNLEDGREHHVTIKPEEFELAPSHCATVWITYLHGSLSTYSGSSRNLGYRSESSIKGSRRIQEEVAKLIVVSGDIPTSSRLHRICEMVDDNNIKRSDLFCDMNAVNLNFIEAATNHHEFAIEDDNYYKEDTVLCDPVSKEVLNSLLKNVSSFEVMLAVEKIENSQEDLRHSVGDLTLALESSSVEFHPLMDDGDTNLLQIMDPHCGNSCVARRQDGDFRENRFFGDPKGMKDLKHLENLAPMRTHGYRENVFADTSVIIFPSTKVGDKSSGKLTLRNISPETYEVEFHLQSGPFIPPKKDIIIAGQKHVSFKVKFVPNNPGFYETTMIMKATSRNSTSENIIIVALKGTAN